MRITEEEYRALIGGTPPKKRKYNNEPLEFDGHKFDSIKESEYYLLFKQQEKNGEIRDLKLQYPIEIQPAFTDRQGNKIQAIIYRADFYFYDVKLKTYRIVDVKGGDATKTAAYKLKKKLLLYKGIEIEEV